MNKDTELLQSISSKLGWILFILLMQSLGFCSQAVHF